MGKNQVNIQDFEAFYIILYTPSVCFATQGPRNSGDADKRIKYCTLKTDKMLIIRIHSVPASVAGPRRLLRKKIRVMRMRVLLLCLG